VISAALLVAAVLVLLVTLTPLAFPKSPGTPQVARRRSGAALR
jgi:hypothetical protein